MPYRDAASGIASLGRYGDDTLVHMNRDEVQGLQALAMAQGGSLSINPYTGLPEAFDLKGAFKKFLPTIVGGALAATGFGAPAAALAGGLTGAATSKGNLLEGFAMGALGGWAGSGLTQGLVPGAGGAAPTGGAGASTTDIASKAASSASTPSLANVPGATGITPPTPAGQLNLGGAGTPNLNNVPGAFGATPPTPVGQLNLGTPGVPNVANIPGAPGVTPPPAPGLTGAKGAFNDMAEGLVDKIVPTGLQETVRNPGMMQSGIAALTSGASREEVPEMKKQGPLFRQYNFDPKTRRFTAKEPSDTWQDPYAPGYAEGGALNNITAQNNYLANLSRGGASDTDINGFTGEPRYAQGGMPPSGGRFLKGPGDGVSDSIPAEIPTEKGPIPAKLAAGEFVFPARAVAELGNGDGEAGARELYAMLDRIEARMRKSKRGKDSGARKELVA